jgi:hypothetical protein
VCTPSAKDAPVERGFSNERNAVLFKGNTLHILHDGDRACDLPVFFAGRTPNMLTFAACTTFPDVWRMKTELEVPEKVDP